MKPPQVILKNNVKHKHIRKQWKLILNKINTFEKRNKVDTTQWRKIYEVIEEDYFIESDMFPDDFIKNVRIMEMKLLI